jgi:tetratricopeptide (TPR) repeat protein
VLFVALILVSVSPARAENVFQPNLVRAATRLDAARGSEAYSALRQVWSTWDSADPAQVEELLRATAADTQRSPSVRAYAKALVGYARLRRGDIAGAQWIFDELGYVKQWLVVGPFDNEGKAGFGSELEPELDLGRPVVPGRAYSGKQRAVRWRKAPDVFPFGWVDTSSLLRPEEKVCVYAKTFVRGRAGSKLPRAASLWVGASGAVRVWFDGKVVLEDSAYRGHDVDRQAAEIQLTPGLHELMLKVCGENDAPVFSLRIADPRGEPDRALDVVAELSAHVDAKDAQPSAGAPSTGAAPLKGERPKLAPPKRRGPLAELEERANAKTSRAADWYALAEYLVWTRSDDPTEHRARDLAARAADAEPTVDRLVLAAMLAEDRNQARSWLERAEGIVQKTGAANVELLITRASHARGGVNWRDAFPFYEAALRLEPDNVDAIQGEVELYNEAGLTRTALNVLERALERNPSSVNLLNMYAGQLRALGRSTEANLVEARYAGLRFDDRNYLDGRISLAVARGETQVAQTWIDRLLALAPDSLWAHGVAGQAYRRLGEPERATLALQRAVELAPEDITSLKALADLQGELGMRDDQVALLRRILEVSPQERDVREYLEHAVTPETRADETWAWGPERFLPLRNQTAAGENRRTLRQLTVTTVFPNGKSSKFHQLVYQPLTDAAAATARQFAFQYQADREVVRIRAARVHRRDGQVDEAIESGEGAADQPEISMYTSARTYYVQLPRLEPGDVVELQYRVDDIAPRNEFADHFADMEYFERGEPVHNAEFVLITPKSRRVLVDNTLPGLEQQVEERGEQRLHRFFAKHIAPLVSEPGMPPLPEVAGSIHVTTYASYADMGKWYWGLVRDQFDLDDETRKLAREIAKDAKTDLEKVRAVYDWVVKNTRYVALEFGIYGFKPRRAVQTVARGWGDCKDKATVIVTLLKELGVPAEFVIVRTQMRGALNSKLASFAPFDHAIAYVPSLDLYLDGTAENAGAAELPPMDLGAVGFHVGEGLAKLTTLPQHDPKKNVVKRSIRAQLDKTGSGKLEVNYEVQGSTAPEWRARFQAKSTQRERLQTVLLGPSFPGFVLADGNQAYEVNDLTRFNEPVRVSARGSSAALARREGDQLSLAVTPSARLTPLFASLPQRRQDVSILVFPSAHETYEVKLPPGAQVVSAPQNVSKETPFGAYRLEVVSSGSEVVVKSSLELRTSRVRPAEYADFRRFCLEADAAMSQRLVVKP